MDIFCVSAYDNYWIVFAFSEFVQLFANLQAEARLTNNAFNWYKLSQCLTVYRDVKKKKWNWKQLCINNLIKWFIVIRENMLQAVRQPYKLEFFICILYMRIYCTDNFILLDQYYYWFWLLRWIYAVSQFFYRQLIVKMQFNYRCLLIC